MKDSSRRTFVKQTAATGLTFTFAGLIRAHGQTGGGSTSNTTWNTTENTTWSPDIDIYGSTYDTTFDSSFETSWSPDIDIYGSTYETTYNTTFDSSYETTWDPDGGDYFTLETTESTLPSTAQLRIWQMNFPFNCLAVTDMGGMHGYQLIVPSEEKMAYINGIPEIPALFAKIDGADAGTNVVWSMTLTTERLERQNLDERSYPQIGESRVLAENEEWDIGFEFLGEFNGGIAKVSYECVVDGKTCKGSAFFTIRGKNPTDADAKAYVQAMSNLLGVYPYAWGMVQHESRQGNKVYNQFNTDGMDELPNLGLPDGWGIAQLDRPLEVRASTNETYNWKSNINKFFVEMQQVCEPYATKLLAKIATQYPNHPAALNPPDLALNGVSLNAKDWATMIRYNGVFGPLIPNFKGMKAAVTFEPNRNPQWKIEVNSNNYAHKVSLEIGGQVYVE